MVLNVLICGGGCAGPSLAFWLARAGHRVTVVERFPALRASGAQIDLRAQGIQVAKRMGIIDAVRSKVVDEDGIAWVDQNGTDRAKIMANKSGKGAQTMTSEFEIMRGDLVRILYDVTKNDVEYIFGISVDRFEQDEKSVTAYFSDGSSGTYDILVGADGQGSRIRKAILPQDDDPVRHIGMYIAHWLVPTVASDDKFARGLHLPGGRLIMTRSHSPVESQACFIMRQDSEELRSIPRASIEKQKEFWVSKFNDAGWVAPRLIEGMDSSEYFYSQEIVQIRTDTWFKGRVALLADAAHCPSPMTGMGTTSALVGSYVLAGEIVQNADNLEIAFANYDKTLRPFINDIQWLPTWMLPIAIPGTQWGINLLHFVTGWISYLRIPELAARFSKEEKGGWVLPEYPLLHKTAERGE